jgi:hypothetical protein
MHKFKHHKIALLILSYQIEVLVSLHNAHLQTSQPFEVLVSLHNAHLQTSQPLTRFLLRLNRCHFHISSTTRDFSTFNVLLLSFLSCKPITIFLSCGCPAHLSNRQLPSNRLCQLSTHFTNFILENQLP